MLIKIIVKLKMRLPLIAIVFFAGCMAFFSYQLYFTWHAVEEHFEEYERAEKAYEDIYKTVHTKPKMTTLTEPEEKSKESEVFNFDDNDEDEQLIENEIAINEETQASSFDFAPLLAINPDVVGWITIPGTNIDYPIVQGENNEFYLDRLIDGTENANGSIFLDCNNAPTFQDPNIFIYGHHMKNGSMFADLPYYKDQDYYNQHPEIIFYTPEGDYNAKIFSAYTTEPVSKSFSYVWTDEYIQLISESSLINTGVEVSSNERIITLSTCDYDFDNARMVVHAVIR